ncbi:asparaginase [Actinomadura keratinilytica]|uniref:asparaginase n=1 Tax=Actinomadura keratinilytica TaxID=547461 RepID=A0ABP7Y2W1_9ACTN
MRQLILVGTGGTIATTDAPGGRRVGVPTADLLAASRAVWADPGVRVEVRELRRTASFAASVADALTLAAELRDAARAADGVVVTHGTDTLEEVAFLLGLAHDSAVPVVLTGAQRPFDDPAADGPRNLAAALRWAASDAARGTGVTVVFDDRVWPATGVRKVSSLSPAAFAAPGRGPLARVDEAGVRPHAVPALPRPLLTGHHADLPRVDVVAQYLGADAAAVRAARDAGARGVVLAGFGAGNATPETTAACLDLLREGIPVAVASRVGEGAVVGLYAGGGADLAAAGALFAGDLSPWQARLLLAAAIAADPSGSPARVAARCRTWLVEAGALGRPAAPTRSLTTETV